MTDRLGGVTTYVYTATGQLASIMDAEGQVTSYTYNARNEKTVETYPDHTGGNPGDAGYGKIQFAYDPAGRLELSRGKRGRESCVQSTRRAVPANDSRPLFPVPRFKQFQTPGKRCQRVRK